MARLVLVAVVVIVVLVFLGGHHELLGLLHAKYLLAGQGVVRSFFKVCIFGKDTLLLLLYSMFCYNLNIAADLRFTITSPVSYRLSQLV